MIDVGDNVVCVTDDWFPAPETIPLEDYPRKGNVYTVIGIRPSDYDPNIIVLRLKEFPNHGWARSAFRKVEDPKKGMEVLRNRLTPIRELEPA